MALAKQAKNVLNQLAASLSAFVGSLMILFSGSLRSFGHVMAPHQREWIEALAPSIQAIASGKVAEIRRFYIEATKGSGKDTVLAAICMWLAAFANRPLLIQVAAADRDQADELWKAAKEWLHHSPWLSRHVELKNFKIIGTKNGVEVEIISSDVTGSHGARPDILIVNECSHIGKWEFVQNLLDNASKVAHGIVIIATNAGFTDSEAHKLRKIVMDSPRWSKHIYNKPAPQIDADELEEIERRSRPYTRFRRLFWGEWTSGSGDALSPEEIDAAFAAGLPMVSSTPNGFNAVGGYDGAVNKHFASFVIVGKHVSGRYRVLRCWLWKPPRGGSIDLDNVESTVANAIRDYGLKKLALDPAKFEHGIQHLKKLGLNITIDDRQQSGARLVEQYHSIIDNFTSRNIDCPPYGPLEHDLRNLRVEEKAYGARLVSDDGPEGHGDSASALSIAMAAAKGMQVMPQNIVLPVDPRFPIGGIGSSPSRLFGMPR